MIHPEDPDRLGPRGVDPGGPELAARAVERDDTGTGRLVGIPDGEVHAGAVSARREGDHRVVQLEDGLVGDEELDEPARGQVALDLVEDPGLVTARYREQRAPDGRVHERPEASA